MDQLETDAGVGDLLAAAAAVGDGDAEVVRHAHSLVARVGDWCVRVERSTPERVAAQFDAAAVLTRAGVATISPRGDEPRACGGGWVASVWHWEDDLGLRAGSRGLGRTIAALASVRGVEGLPSADPIVVCRERIAELVRLAPGPLAGELDDLARRVVSLEGVVADRGEYSFVHGDLHPGNLIATERGWVVCDLESAGRGPRDYDVSVCALRADRYDDEPRLDAVLDAAGAQLGPAAPDEQLGQVYATSITVGAYWVAVTRGAGLDEARKRGEWLRRHQGPAWRFL